MHLCLVIATSGIESQMHEISLDSQPVTVCRCVLNLVIERNLDNDLSHSSAELAIRGALSTVYCSIDSHQYMLVKAMLDQNLGEDLTDLQSITKQLPHIQTVLTGQVRSAQLRVTIREFLDSEIFVSWFNIESVIRSTCSISCAGHGLSRQIMKKLQLSLQS